MVNPPDWADRWRRGFVGGGPDATSIIRQLNTIEELSLALQIEVSVRNCKGTVANILERMRQLSPNTGTLRVRGGKRA